MSRTFLLSKREADLAIIIELKDRMMAPAMAAAAMRAHAGHKPLIETRKRETPAAFATGVSVILVAGTGFEPVTFRL
jgi:hypothetical protein